MKWEIRAAGWVWAVALMATICGGMHTGDQRWWWSVAAGTIFLAVVACLSEPIRSGRFNVPAFLSAMGIMTVIAGMLILEEVFSKAGIAAILAVGLGVAIIAAFADRKRYWQNCVFFRKLAEGHWEGRS